LIEEQIPDSQKELPRGFAAVDKTAGTAIHWLDGCIPVGVFLEKP
jgi:hypothetical protein